MLTGYPGIEMRIQGAGKKDVNLEPDPGRLYVRGNGKKQSGAQIILKISGLKPNSRIYWSYEYNKGPLNQRNTLYTNPFSSCPDFSFYRKDNSTITDENGETRLLFTSTTYAGDSFRIGAGFQRKEDHYQQFAGAEIKSKHFVVWKRLYLEQPKVLKNVRFPRSTWELVRSNLEKLSIEITMKSSPVEFDPSCPAISSYFSGMKDDLRYGPRYSLALGAELSHIGELSSDRSTSTINVVILGAVSKNHDLIKNPSLSSSLPPQPVNYDYLYKKRDVNLSEFMSYGTAVAMIGDCPSIFIWSDYWWMFSKIVKVDHDKALARVILHELGHHLLRSQFAARSGILDAQGHLTRAVTANRSIMNGYKLLQTDTRGRVFFSPVTTRQERRFIKHPTWHPQVERLIRQYYIPLRQ